MKVAILDDYQRAVPGLTCFAKLAGHEAVVLSEPVKDAAELAEFDALVLIRQRTRVTAAMLEALPRLKLIVQTAAIGPHVDVAACRSRGVTVCHGSGSPTCTAELTWALILAAARNIVPECDRLRRGLWQGSIGFALAGRRLGFLGFGKIAQRLVRYAAAFEMRVSVWGRESTLARGREAGLETAASMMELFARSDVLSVQLRLTDETRGMIRFEHLAAMGPEAIFVNASRAEVVEKGALERALRAGRPGKVALDVYENEPLFGAVDPVLALPNVTATPHLGFVERDNYEHYFGDAFDAVNAFAAGRPMRVVA